MALTGREKKFVAAFDGNGTKACKAAGYAGDNPTLATQAWRLMRKPEVLEALKKREEGSLELLSLSVAELQQVWTRTILDDDIEPVVRMMAARDLAKSQGAFVHRHEVAIGKSLEEFLREITTEPKK